MQNKSKKILLGASMVIALTLTGCGLKDKDTGQGDDKDGTEQVQEAQPLYIPQPDIMDIEDDVIDTAKLKENLDKINDGERLEDYEPVNEEERVLELPDGFEFNDSVYDLKDPKDLKEGTHLVYIGRNTCPYCTLLRVNLDPVVEQLGINLGYVDTDNKKHEDFVVKEFGLSTVPQIVVIHDGEFVATFPQEHMYLESGVNYQSLANGLGDLTNIYLSYKYDVELEGIKDEQESDEQESDEQESDEQESDEQE